MPPLILGHPGLYMPEGSTSWLPELTFRCTCALSPRKGPPPAAWGHSRSNSSSCTRGLGSPSKTQAFLWVLAVPADSGVIPGSSTGSIRPAPQSSRKTVEADGSEAWLRGHRSVRPAPPEPGKRTGLGRGPPSAPQGTGKGGGAAAPRGRGRSPSPHSAPMSAHSVYKGRSGGPGDTRRKEEIPAEAHPPVPLPLASLYPMMSNPTALHVIVCPRANILFS